MSAASALVQCASELKLLWPGSVADRMVVRPEAKHEIPWGSVEGRSVTSVAILDQALPAPPPGLYPVFLSF